MDRQILNITANEQILTCDNPIKISTNKVNYIEARFDLGQNWTGYDSIRAVWFNDFYCISTVLDSNGVAFVPSEVMKRNGFVKVNLVGSISENDVLTDRLTSYPIVAVIVDCTAQINGAETSPITPSQFEQYVAIVRDLVNSVKDIDHIELNDDYTLTIYYSDGTSDTTTSIRGADGNGIESVTKTGASGLVDTYTITFTDGQTTTFTVTNGAKGDTGNGISSISKTSTVGLVDTYTITYTNGTTTTFTVTNGEKGEKGDTGEVSLSELEDATIVQTLSDNEPYNYRRTNGGNGAGHREYDEIVGASVGWNQLVKNGNFSDGSSNWSVQNATYGSISVSDGELTYTLSALGTELYHNTVRQSINTLKDHVYLNVYDMYVSKQSTVVDIYLNIAHTTTINSGWNRLAGIMKPSSSYSVVRYGLASSTGYSVGDTYKIKNANLVDLTLALGTTIADYVATLESTTAGSGVAWLKTHFPKLFDNGYQPYDSGSIKSVGGLSAHEMVGVNQWDEEWELGIIDISTGQNTSATNRIRSKNYIQIVPSTTYYCYFGAMSSESASKAIAFFYDADKGYIGYANANCTTVTAPTNAHYMRFYCASNYGTTYNHDISINLSDTSINGQYFPYESHTYPLDSSVTLRGRYVLDNGQLKAVGDVWKSVGEITRNAIEIDLGTLSWRRNGSGTPAQFYASLPSRGIDDITGGNVVCSKYAGGRAYNGSTDKVVCIRSAQAWLTDDSYSDGTALKASLDGVKLVYPLETSTTESATPYDNPQLCDSNGTEEYVGSELPVGHNTDYPMSLVDTMPSANGTYEPRVTIANGKRTITWVSV